MRALLTQTFDRGERARLAGLFGSIGLSSERNGSAVPTPVDTSQPPAAGVRAGSPMDLPARKIAQSSRRPPPYERRRSSRRRAARNVTGHGGISPREQFLEGGVLVNRIVRLRTRLGQRFRESPWPVGRHLPLEPRSRSAIQRRLGERCHARVRALGVYCFAGGSEWAANQTGAGRSWRDRASWDLERLRWR